MLDTADILAAHPLPPEVEPGRSIRRPLCIDLAAERAKARARQAGEASVRRISYPALAAAIAVGLVLGLSAGMPIAWQIDRALAPEWAE